jgi:DNA-binding NtrC family response regulator
MNEKILIIDDEESLRYTFKRFLCSEGYEVESVGDFDESMRVIAESNYDLIISDIILGSGSGMEILQKIAEGDFRCPLILVTGYPDIKTATEAVRLGAFDYLVKPVLKETLLRVTKLALESKRLADRNSRNLANMETALFNAADPMLAVNTERTISAINNAAERFIGGSRRVLGMNATRLFHGCNERLHKALNQAMDSKQAVKVSHLEFQLGTMPKATVNLTALPIFHPGDTLSGAILTLEEEAGPAPRISISPPKSQFAGIIGKSKAIRDIYPVIEELKDLQTPVLITGESGTGKELVAEAIHYLGKRKDKPMVKVNCCALPEGLLESEIFGHVKGAFTGAVKDRIGRFKLAEGGTIFLDEIGDMPIGSQQRLLRVLQDYEFERVGESAPIKVDVRIIAATNKNLPERIKNGDFREDLYYRLKVMEIALPPLRNRREDIIFLLEHFMSRLRRKIPKKIRMVSEEVLQIFSQHPWPGNVRQLENVLEHAFILCRNETITVDCLPKEFQQVRTAHLSGCRVEGCNNESQRIVRALEETGWNKTKAANLLGMSRRTIYRKMKKHGIAQPEAL